MIIIAKINQIIQKNSIINVSLQRIPKIKKENYQSNRIKNILTFVHGMANLMIVHLTNLIFYNKIQIRKQLESHLELHFKISKMSFNNKIMKKRKSLDASIFTNKLPKILKIQV